MKIGLVIPGGVDRSGRDRVVPMFLWLIERLARRHDLHVLVLDYYEEPCTYPLLGATVHDLGRVRGLAGTRRYLIARRLARALRACGPFDVLHAYWGLPAIAAVRAAPRELPIVVTLDSGELVRLDDIGYGLQRRAIDRRALAGALGRAAAITVPTHFMANLMRHRGRLPRIVPMGVDRAAFPLKESSDGPPWRLVRVGSINPVKDCATLLRAFAAVVRHEPRVTLDIAGEDTLAGAMRQLADSLRLGDRVVFHGLQPTDRIARLYAGAHLNVVSSRHESANVTVLEAACCGLPTVGTNVGYVADWQPERALAVPPADPEALAGAILALLHDRDRRQRMAAAARAWALAHDADWTADTFEALYHELIPESRRVR
jgi:glycosyltransferase involved in cell wall biosynthesis